MSGGYFESYIPPSSPTDVGTLPVGTHGSNNQLEAYRKLAKIAPFAFWGFDNPAESLCTDDCIWREYHWQAGRVSRDDMRQALSEAEAKLRGVNRVPVGSQWFAERVNLPSHYYNPDLRYPAIQLAFNYVQALGLPFYTKIESPAVILKNAGGTPFAESGDAVPSSFTATIPMPDPAIDLATLQAHVHEDFRVEDGINNNSQLAVTIKLNGSDIVVTGKPWMLGSPQHWESSSAELDATKTASYMDKIELWTLVNKTDGVTVDDATVIMHGASADTVSRGGVRTGKTGLVYVTRETYANDNWALDTYPVESHHQATIRYLAGANNQQDYAGYDLLLAKLATGLLPTICDCGDVDSSFFRQWSDDLAAKLTAGGTDKFNFTFDDLNNPWGSTRGAIAAYKEATSIQRRVGRGVVL